MSFYTAQVQHPTTQHGLETQHEYSGEAVAGATLEPLISGSERAASGVWLKNESVAEGVRVVAPGHTAGFLLSPNTSRFFPVDDVNRIYVKRAGGVNAALSYWAG